MTSEYDDYNALPKRQPPFPKGSLPKGPLQRGSLQKGASSKGAQKAPKSARQGPVRQGASPVPRFVSHRRPTAGATVQTGASSGQTPSLDKAAKGNRQRGLGRTKLQAGSNHVGGQIDAGSQPEQSPSGFLGTLSEIRWLRSWPLVMLIIFSILGVSGGMALVSLFRIPNLPNCRAIFWPTASASLRLQCAESYAAQGDVKNLLAAIALVDKLPEDHPLRSDIINDRIETWANLVLDLAERSFEEGNLEEAIESARKIPARTAAAEVVEERIERWQAIWKEGEEGFNAAIEKLKEKDFQSAFTLSVVLLDVDNKYWSTTKYNELTKQISLAREDSRRLSEALGYAKEGTLKGYREALSRLNDIKEESVFYAEAQGERKKIAGDMLEASETLLEDRNLSAARAMLSAIPRDVGLDNEIEDFQTFLAAYQQAWAGNINGLQNAISRMRTLGRNRPLYEKGQQLIAQWEVELEEIALLNQAKERASRGGMTDLTAAIAIAEQVSRNSPQWQEASTQIDDWRTRIETTQDRPILERADRLAAVGTADNLRAAIQEARKIRSGRTLEAEADQRIATWTGRIQRLEDQPILDQARQRASTGDRVGAIAIASRIGADRVLYSAAQEDISRWQVQENGRTRLGEAVNAAASGDANSLANAIDIAARVPAGSDSRDRAVNQINRWSWDLLRQAEATANRNLETAITLASRIPAQAEAYDSAQVRISNWQETLRQIEESRRPVVPPPPGSTPAIEGNGDNLPQQIELAPNNPQG